MNLENALIKQCICGNTDELTQNIHNEVDLLCCNKCGLTHQLLYNFSHSDLNEFYIKKYHLDFQQQKDFTPYRDRYIHDCKVADNRISAYQTFIKKGMVGLDIGSSNSAFVHRCIAQGIDCVGLEPGEHIGDSAVTIRGTLDSFQVDTDSYNFVTMHDSIEHMIDPAGALDKVHRMLMPHGIAIIDLPDFYIPAGDHHWKVIEHLWYFKQNEFIDLLMKKGFNVELVTTPIPGKLVFFARVIK